MYNSITAMLVITVTLYITLVLVVKSK